MTQSSRFSLFAVTPPGLEDLTRAELFSLGINHPRAVPGGVAFEGFLSHLYRINLWSRTASRVLVRLGEFQAVAFDELRRKAADLPWENFLRPGQPVNVRAACHKSKLYHSDAVAERVVSAIQDHLGQESKIELQRRKEEKENLASFAPSRVNSEVIVRIDHDHCILSLNSSGAHLHQRGYRLQTAKAPLRETLAAALLLHASYNPAQPLLDPFCGAGTFAIEAALIARNIAPGLNRRFAFVDWINFDTQEWGEQLKKARAAITDSMPIILASDRDEGAIAAAQANAERAGAADSIQFSIRPLSAIEPPSKTPGLLISNLPYGERIRSDTPNGVRNLYAQFGKVVKEKCPDWRVGIVAGSMTLAKQTRLAFGEPLMIENGGLHVPFIIKLPPL